MPDEATSPATAAPSEGSATPAPEATAPEAPVSATPSAAPAPDIDSLLNDPALRKRLLEHPTVAKDFEHRAKSVRAADVDRQAAEAVARARAQWQAEADQQRQAATEAEMEALLEQLVADDPTDPRAQRLKPILEAKRQRREMTAAEQRAMAERQKAELELRQQFGGFWMGEIDALEATLREEGLLADEDKATLRRDDPERFPRPMAYLRAVVEAAAKRRAAKLAKAEAEAMVAERLGQALEKQQGPATLPNGAAGGSDSEFLADYAAGKTNNTARQLKWMREHGIVV